MVCSVLLTEGKNLPHMLVYQYILKGGYHDYTDN